MVHRDTPYIKVNIELDSYELANILRALELVPNTGQWLSQVQSKIATAIEEKGYLFREFYFHPNAGMTLEGARRHLMILEMKEKHSKTVTE